LVFFPGSAVGLIFPEETGDSVYELLDDILQGIVTRVTGKVKRSVQQGDTGYSSSIARGIVTGNVEVDPNRLIIHNIYYPGDWLS
jgi:hypothetical protein